VGHETAGSCHPPDVPPEVTWPPPLDWTGAEAGACKVPELPWLPESLDGFEEPEDFAEPEDPEEPDAFEEPDSLEEPDALEEPADFAAPEVADDFEEPAEWLVLVTAVCVLPGSAAATAPAAATLAKLTAAVALLRRRRPRSRSATARETLCAVSSRDPRSRGGS
jgi:hypothetical protein